MPPIISVENLGKCYTVRHQCGGGPRYRRLSEEVASAFANPFRRLFHHNGSQDPSSSAPSPQPQAPGASSERFWALRNVSFEVHEGEVVGIIGRNGAGKSTLLKVLSRITEPSEGRVRIRGRVASLLEVGTGFHPELTGRENVFLNGAILGMSRAEIRKKFDEIVAFAEVEKFLDTPVKHFSSGMYVRLAFAVAAHLEPEILIVDEVLAVGDLDFQNKCLSKIEGVTQKHGRTVLLVSHTLPLIKQLTNRAIMLEQGQIRAAGDPGDVVAKYLNGSRGNVASRHYSAIENSGSPNFTEIHVQTSDPGHCHRIWSPLQISFQIYSPFKHEDLWLSFKVLENDSRAACFACYQDPLGNRPHHQLGPLNKGSHAFTCRLSTFPGYMGDYSLQATLFDSRKGVPVDVVDNVCPFSVYIPSDFVAGGEWRTGLCAFLVPFQWIR